MKITAVNVYPLSAPIREPFRFSQARVGTRVALLVEIETDEGIVGWGEGYGPPRLLASVVENYAELLVGADPLAGDAIWEALYNRLRDHGQKGVVIQGLSAVDIALWDIRGKAFGVPVHRLMGGPLRTEVQAYATGLYLKDWDDPAIGLADEAAGYVEEGFKAMKLKVGFGIDHDVRMTDAVRGAIGDHAALMIDANHGYDAVSAIALGRRIEHHRIGWFEEPVPPEDLRGYREVKAALSIPVAGGECEFTRFGFRDILAERMFDVVQPDTCAAGGLTECKKIADMAAAFGVRYVPHVWGTGIAIATALQLLAVVPRNPPGLYPNEPMMEFDQSEHPFRFEVTPRISHRDGIVQVPTGPGLGIEVDRDAVMHYRMG
ncbi:MAG: mandelate racemase [Rhodospirillaceae bacterium]|nr:mandelate racemase [Rhodospirillaceae bacterium]